MSDRQWWAARYSHNHGPAADKICGPYSTREAAAKAFWIKFPFRSSADMHNNVMTGYGTFGPSFDIQWIKRESEDV